MLSQTHYSILAKGVELTLRCPAQPGYVYLIHFSEPYKHARHYLGSAGNLQARLDAHRAGSGARLMEVITDAGISWHVSRIWECPTVEEARTLEAHYKRQRDGVRLCPECKHMPLDPLASLMAGHWPMHVFSNPRPRQPMGAPRPMSYPN